ncbi:hypothetical protein RUM43_009518 [Polyplax serrata]|uniref:BTB domain-containing protein n=1 Tax=Polyplax serrata TaxID=468196 RepID=A0AAN8NQM9_POLSC
MANCETGDEGSTPVEMTTPNLMERMQALYESNKWHDRVFKLWKSDGDGEELIFAHNIVLASSSPVFEALCFGPMAEKSTIEVPDIDPAAFRTMLKFIYTDLIEFNSVELACNVLYASKKYLIYTLVEVAISYITHHINESNCLQIYEFSSFIQEERLIKASWSYLCSHLDYLLPYFSQETLSTDLVKNLVNEDALNGGEIIIFKICLMWAESECKNNNIVKNSKNLRKLLVQADILSKIRWLTMSLDEFEECPVKSGILTKEEIAYISDKILQNCNRDKLDYLNRSSTDEMKTEPLDRRVYPESINNTLVARKKIQLKKFYCHRFIEREVRPNLVLSNQLEISTFVTVNRSVRLTAVLMNAKILPVPHLHNGYMHVSDIERDYYEKLLIDICDTSNKTLFSKLFFEKVGYGTVFKIPLDTPVLLEKSQEYKIQISLVNFSENYLFGVRNPISKFPSGFCVTFRELANIGDNGKLVEAHDLSLIAGLELCL